MNDIEKLLPTFINEPFNFIRGEELFKIVRHNSLVNILDRIFKTQNIEYTTDKKFEIKVLEALYRAIGTGIKFSVDDLIDKDVEAMALKVMNAEFAYDASDYSKDNKISAGISFSNQYYLSLFNSIFDNEFIKFIKNIAPSSTKIYFTRYLFNCINWTTNGSIDYRGEIEEFKPRINFCNMDIPVEMNFTGATFDAVMSFKDINFKKGIDFSQVSSKLQCDDSFIFERVSFNERAIFNQQRSDLKVIIHKSNFLKEADFSCSCFNILRISNTSFEDNVSFHSSAFKSIQLDTTIFNGNVDFSHTEFKTIQQTNFNVVNFNDLVIFDNVKCDYTIDITKCAFAKELNVVNINIKDKLYHFYNLSDRYCVLKKLAERSKNNDRKLDFFAYEMMAKRNMLSWKNKTRGELFINYAYQYISDYGRSFMRPLGYLVGVWISFGLMYTIIALICNSFNNGAFWCYFFTSIKLSASHIAPFLVDDISNKQIELLFHNSDASWLFWASSFQSLLGLILIFLIGLGLRNRYLIK